MIAAVRLDKDKLDTGRARHLAQSAVTADILRDRTHTDTVGVLCGSVKVESRQILSRIATEKQKRSEFEGIGIELDSDDTAGRLFRQKKIDCLA